MIVTDFILSLSTSHGPCMAHGQCVGLVLPTLSLLGLWNKGLASAEAELQASGLFASPSISCFFTMLVASTAQGEGASLLRPGGQSNPAALESANEPGQRATCRRGSEREVGLEDELQAAGATGRASIKV
jgi:hypothetical protein